MAEPATRAVYRESRVVLIRASSKAIVRARLLWTPTAACIWAALPIYALAERHADALHCATHIAMLREEEARQIARVGDIAFWPEKGRIVMPCGAPPQFAQNALQLPAPCNLWAQALDDATALSGIKEGDTVAFLVAES